MAKGVFKRKARRPKQRFGKSNKLGPSLKKAQRETVRVVQAMPASKKGRK